jgi:choline dehydrogenase-like flavoprotein
LIGGNTHAPAVMIAEKCADYVLAADGAAATFSSATTEALAAAT